MDAPIRGNKMTPASVRHLVNITTLTKAIPLP